MRRTLIGPVLAALALLMLLSVSVLPSAHAAKGPTKPKPPKPPKAQAAHVAWSMNGTPVTRLEAPLATGATTTIKLMFTSTTALSDVQFRASGGLARYATVTPASLAAVGANVPVEVTLTVAATAQKAHTQAGVMHARSGKRALGRPLQVKLKLPKPSSGADSDD